MQLAAEKTCLCEGADFSADSKTRVTKPEHWWSTLDVMDRRSWPHAIVKEMIFFC